MGLMASEIVALHPVVVNHNTQRAVGSTGLGWAPRRLCLCSVAMTISVPAFSRVAPGFRFTDDGWQLSAEDAACAQHAAHGHFAAHHLTKAAREGQPKAGAAELARG